jgi:hypothetical protein
MAAQGSEQEAAALAGAVIAAHRHNGDGKHISQPMDTMTATHERAVLLVSTGVLIGAAGNTYERPGSDCRSRGLDQPLWSQTATNSTGLLAPPLVVAVDNYQGAPRGADEPLPTQVGSETLGLLTARVLPNRTNGTSRSLTEPMETLVGSSGSGGLGLLSAGVVPLRKSSAPVAHGEPLPTATASQTLGMLTAAGSIKNNGPIEEAKYRAHPLSDPLGTVVSSAVTQGLLFSGWYKQNGSQGNETAPHPLSDPFGTLTARDTTALLTAEWKAALAELALEDCYFRMMFPGVPPGLQCYYGTTFCGRSSGRDLSRRGRKKRHAAPGGDDDGAWRHPDSNPGAPQAPAPVRRRPGRHGGAILGAAAGMQPSGHC